jgi:excisionase family DNA binding protein
MDISSTFTHQQAGLIKATDVATILNISRAMAYRLMQQGAIRTVCIGTARRVRSEDLQSYIEDNLTSHITEQ